MAIITQGLSHQSFAGSEVCCSSELISETLHVKVWIDRAKIGDTGLQRFGPVEDGRLVELVPKACWLHITLGNGEGFVCMRRLRPIDFRAAFRRFVVGAHAHELTEESRTRSL